MNSELILLLVGLSVTEVLSSHYHGPTVHSGVPHNGYLAGTHEVAAAKSAHLATLSHNSHGYLLGDKALGNGAEHGHQHGDFRYHGPTAVPHVLQDGHIADTHEVAAAKAKHLSAVSKARGHGGYDGHHAGEYNHGSQPGGAHPGSYHGPLFKPVLLQSGYLADTHEVAAAKSAHLASIHHQSQGYHHGEKKVNHGSEYNHHRDIRYHGPTAVPHVLYDGNIADTHEVTTAKAEHLSAVSKAKTHGGFNGHHAGEYNHGIAGIAYHGSYNVPLFKPILQPSHLVDIHEVAAVKSTHLAHISHQFHGYPHGDKQVNHGSVYSHHTDYRHHGPTTVPKILHDGHIEAQTYGAKLGHLDVLRPTNSKHYVH